jgi:hypothetical protein
MNFETRSRPTTGSRAARTTPPAIRVGDNVRRKETFQCGEISFLRGGDEGIEKALSLDRTHGRMTPIGDMFPSAGDELTGVRLTEMKDLRDLPMWVM